MLKFRVLIFLVATTAISQNSFSQNLPSEAAFLPISKDGTKIGCSVQYTVISRDHVYRSGGMIGVTSSLTWMHHDRMGIALMLKIIGADIENNNSTKPQTFKISNAFAIVNGKTISVFEKFACENTNGFCGAVEFAKSMELANSFVAGNETVSFGYNRKSGGLDVSVAVPMLSLKQNSQLAHCMVEVMENAKAAMTE